MTTNNYQTTTKSTSNNDVNSVIRYSIDDFFIRKVKIDYELLKRKVHLATTPRVEELHLMHSVYGHACEGHGEFYDIINKKKVSVKYKDITFDDVIKQLPNQNIERVKRDRQEQIDRTSEWLYNRVDTLKNPGRSPLPEDIRLIKIIDIDTKIKKIEPLAGALMFEHAILKNFESVLIGFYLGSCMDSYEWREKVDAKFGGVMHKGTSVPVDISELRKNNLTLDDLQNSNYLNILPQLNGLSSEKKINALIHMGVIPKKQIVVNNGKYVPAFLELSKGCGISDDAATITTSLQFGIEGGFGVLLADGDDTFDKYTPNIFFGGQDEIIGKKLKNKYESTLNKEFPVSDEQILTMIYLATIDEDNHGNFPSCSQRRFWQKDSYGMTAVQSHMSFLNFLKSDSKYPPRSMLGFSKIWNNDFYSAYVKKLEEAVKNEIIPDTYAIRDKRHALNNYYSE
ncbi:MAG: hypothetical protein ACP5N1_05330 [Candidatus Woesearchaeota archaeon]